MSDGALSQDEIDALLAGVDSSGFGAPAGGAAVPSGGRNDAERKALQDFLSSTVQAQSSNLAMMTGAEVLVQPPRIEMVDRDAFLQKVPDMIVAAKADYVSGFEGEHLIVFGEDTAKRIASLMNKEDNIELDDMAMSVIGEVVSQISGTEITALSDKTGNKGISSEPPHASFLPKAMAALPAGEFARAAYQIDFGDGVAMTFWELFSPPLASAMAKALSPAAAQDGGVDFAGLSGALGGGSPMGAPMGGGGFGVPAGGGFPVQGAPMGAPMGGPMGGAMGGFGASPMMGGGANVQSVQFPNLMPQAAPVEQGNIGLIMDVYMEMTVELGRTRKLIKEILGMGEGTIIELDKLAGEPVDILVNHKLIAKGEVVVIDENFGVRVTEIVSPMERMSDMG